MTNISATAHAKVYRNLLSDASAIQVMVWMLVPSIFRPTVTRHTARGSRVDGKLVHLKIKVNTARSRNEDAAEGTVILCYHLRK